MSTAADQSLRIELSTEIVGGILAVALGFAHVWRGPCTASKKTKSTRCPVGNSVLWKRLV